MKVQKSVIPGVLAKDLFPACLTKEIPPPWVQGFRDDTGRGSGGGDQAVHAHVGAQGLGQHHGTVGLGADTIQQLLNAGLLDELQVDVAALLLGSGVRLFDHLTRPPTMLDTPTVVAGVGVTHLRYAVRTTGHG